MKKILFQAISIYLIVFLIFSCDKNEIADPPFSLGEMWICYNDSVWNDSKIRNELIGTWQWEYVSCFWRPDQAKNVIDSNLTIDFKIDSFLVIKQFDQIIQTSRWEIVDGDADLFSIKDEPSSNLLFGRILICDDKLIFNGSYIDICDNYFRRTH